MAIGQASIKDGQAISATGVSASAASGQYHGTRDRRNQQITKQSGDRIVLSPNLRAVRFLSTQLRMICKIQTHVDAKFSKLSLQSENSIPLTKERGRPDKWPWHHCTVGKLISHQLTDFVTPDTPDSRSVTVTGTRQQQFPVKKKWSEQCCRQITGNDTPTVILIMMQMQLENSNITP